MTILTVRHVTIYRYSEPVGFGEHRLMFRPRDGFDQKVIEATIDIAPRANHIRWLHDVFGNFVTVAEFDARATELRFESDIRLEHTVSDLPDLRIEPEAQVYPFAYNEEELPDLLPFIARRYPDPDNALDRWVRRFLRQGRPNETGALLMTLNTAIRESFVYVRRSEEGTRDPGLTLRLGQGSCRDLALLMIEAVRSLGLAARFVSGLCVCSEPGRTRTSRRRLDACLVPSLPAGGRLGGFRSDQRHRRQSRPDPGRRRARSAAGRAALGHLVRPDRGQSGNVGGGHGAPYR